MRILTVNAGSTSVKLSVVGDGDETMLQTTLSVSDDAQRLDAVLRFADEAMPVDAVCHRIVHGGRDLRETVLVDATVRRQLEAAALFAPLHVPPSLHVLDAVSERVSAPAVACFDTAFHATMQDAATMYAIPQPWRDLGIRRYGFHGLSCAWSLRQTAARLGKPAETLHMLIAHLGGGCSVTAVRDGRSADTTMGFTPLEGLVMTTRSGSVDPAAILFLETTRGIGAGDAGDALEHHSGLVGLAGTPDMTQVLQRAAADDAAAQLALEVFVHHVRRGIGAMAMSLDRIDALVFTGGIGENAPLIRDRACAGGVLGATPNVLVVHAREDLEMAAEARRLLGAPAS
jgi:acetate kinase